MCIGDLLDGDPKVPKSRLKGLPNRRGNYQYQDNLGRPVAHYLGLGCQNTMGHFGVCWPSIFVLLGFPGSVSASSTLSGFKTS